MDLTKRRFRFLTAGIFVIAFIAAGFTTMKAKAEEKVLPDITDKGVEFITDVPEETTEYKAGEGTLTYIPASGGNAAQIVLENAEVYAGTYVRYWSANKTYTAIAAKGDVGLVLKGENNVYMDPSKSNTALLFYDSNVTVTGDGTLTVGYKDTENTGNWNAYPMEVMANNDVSVDDEAYTESGNFELKSGTLTLDGTGSIGKGSLTVNNQIKVSGGVLQTYGQMAGVYSVYGDIELAGGKVRAEDFNEYGLYARRGNVTVGGNTDVYVSSYVRSSSVGISGGSVGVEEENGNVFFNGGKTQVEVPWIGIFAQGNAASENGKVEITAGEVNVEVSEGTANEGAAVYAQGNGADILVSGGNVEAFSGGDNGQISIGLYSDRYIKIEGGTVRAGAENKNEMGAAVGASAEKGIYVTGGTFVAYGESSAVSVAAPYISKGVSVTAATDVAGENTVEYDADDFESYKYLKFESGEILSVTVTPSSASVEKGKTIQFKVEVKGTGSYDAGVKWSISGANGKDTKIDENGQLTVAADESAATITVTAVSVADPEKSASSVVTITAAGSGETQEPSEPESGLPVGAIVGITAGAAVGVAAIAVVIYFIVKKVRK